MSIYRTYALQLDEAFRAARDEYAKLHAAVQAANAKRDFIKRSAPGKTTAEYERDTAEAELSVRFAQAAFDDRASKIWADFRAKRDQIRAELTAASSARNLAMPDAIDQNGLELLKSGILTPEDMEAFVERYNDNPTMLRLVGKYAREAGTNTAQIDAKAAARYNYLAMSVANGQNADVRRWDELKTITDHCGADEIRAARMNPSQIVAMGSHWESLSAPVLAER